MEEDDILVRLQKTRPRISNRTRPSGFAEEQRPDDESDEEEESNVGKLPPTSDPED
jgi:hypothetical protein